MGSWKDDSHENWKHVNIVEYGLSELKSSKFPTKNVDRVDHEAYKLYRKTRS